MERYEETDENSPNPYQAPIAETLARERRRVRRDPTDFYGRCTRMSAFVVASVVGTLTAEPHVQSETGRIALVVAAGAGIFAGSKAGLPLKRNDER